MKKVIIAIFCILMLSLLTACGPKETPQAANENNDQGTAPEQPSVETSGTEAEEVEAVAQDLDNLETVEDDLNFDDLDEIDDVLSDIENI